MMVWCLECVYLHLLKTKRFALGTSLAVQWSGLSSNAGAANLIPCHGVKIPHASQLKSQNTKQQYHNKFNKDLENGPHQKIFIKNASIKQSQSYSE